jgi:hypothetical protein
MTAYPTTRFALLLVLALPLAACGDPVVTDDAGTQTDAATTPSDDAFVTPSDDAFTPVTPDAFVLGPATVLFSRDVLPILEANCRGSGCHTSPQSFFLGGGRGCMGMPLVVAGDPDASFVIDKLEGTLPGGCGMRMPRGRAPLSSENLTTIRTWIEEGARNN